MKNNCWFLVVAPFLLSVLACQASQAAIQTAIAQTQTAEPTLTQTPTPRPTPTPTAALLYAEDFSDPLSGWRTGPDPNDPEAVFNYSEGSYLVSRSKGHNLAAWTFAGQNFDAAVLSVDTWHVSGDLHNTSAALFWRIASDYSRYYMLLMNGESQFSVFKYNNKVSSAVHDWDANAAILPGQKVNHIDIYFVEDLSVIFINKTRVAVFNDSTSLNGDIALGASSSITSGVEIAFDNLAVHSLDRLPSELDSLATNSP